MGVHVAILNEDQDPLFGDRGYYVAVWISMRAKALIMLAVRYHGIRDVRLERVDIPECKSDQVKIKPMFVGICGTDVHEYMRGPTLIPDSTHSLTGAKIPLTIGHEISGLIDEVGSRVEGFQVGDRVVVQPIISDGTCGSCSEGRINCCTQQGFIGLSANGGLASILVVSAMRVFRLPDTIALDVGALIEPLSVAWHAVRTSGFKKGDSALVLGCGPIGLGIIQALKAQEAHVIIVSEVAKTRKELAIELGADYALDPMHDDFVMQTKLICEGEGPAIAFDAVGKQTSLEQAIAAIRPGGTVMNVAVWGSAALVHLNTLTLPEKKLMGTSVYVDRDYREVLDAVASGVISPSRMITRKIGMDRVVEDGLLALANDGANQIKILVDIGQSRRL